MQENIMELYQIAELLVYFMLVVLLLALTYMAWSLAEKAQAEAGNTRMHTACNWEQWRQEFLRVDDVGEYGVHSSTVERFAMDAEVQDAQPY